jgi:hypothetical protein
MIFMRNNPERLAWTVLLLSFAICVGLAVGIPAGINWLVANLTTPLAATADVTANQLVIRYPTTNQVQTLGPRIPADGNAGEDTVREGAVLTVGENDQAVLTISDPGAGTTLCQITLYPNSQLSIVAIRAPRFSQSTQPYRVQVRLDSGRVGISAAFPTTRTLQANVVTPQAHIALTDTGRYSVEVGGATTQTARITQVVVLDGHAEVWANGRSLELDPEQRVSLQNGNALPDAPLPAARNLINDGNFEMPLPNSLWLSDTEALEPPLGSAQVVNLSGRNVLRFVRDGTDHAEVEVIQNIENGDVLGYSSLRLHLAVELLRQSIPVCGTLGSECPIMVELRYEDESRTDRSWFQGFYYLEGADPKRCVQCGGAQADHRQVLQAVAVPYDSENLMEVLAQGGQPKPARILWLRIYASGHSFDAAVTEVELLAQQ